MYNLRGGDWRGSCDPRTVLPLPLCLTPQSQTGHKFQDSLAWGSPGDAGPRWRVRAPPCWARIALRPTAVCPAPACSELTGLTIPASPLPRPFPECQQQFPGRPGDSSLSQPRGNPMPWCQQRVSLGVWGMGLRLCRAGPPDGVGGLPPPTAPLSLPHLMEAVVPTPPASRDPSQDTPFLLPEKATKRSTRPRLEKSPTP